MKKRITPRPGFELLFALSVLAMFTLPALVFGQDKYQKKMSIIIQNGDTTVNGKKLKDLTPAERKDALDVFADNGAQPPHTRNGRPNVYSFRRPGDSTRLNMRIDTFFADKDGRMREFRDLIPRIAPDMQGFNMPDWNGRSFNFSIPHGGNRDFGVFGRAHRNVQNFSFENTDRDGIRTAISFTVSAATPEMAKRVAGTDKTELEINDLTLAPEFTSGKTRLNFELAGKSPAEVSFTSNDGKALWTEKTTGSFSKSFMIPTNGLYFLVVKQAGKTAVKRIVKE